MKRFVVFLFLFFLILSVKTTLAFEYTIEPSLSLSEEYNDNIFLEMVIVNGFAKRFVSKVTNINFFFFFLHFFIELPDFVDEEHVRDFGDGQSVPEGAPHLHRYYEPGHAHRHGGLHQCGILPLPYLQQPDDASQNLP